VVILILDLGDGSHDDGTGCVQSMEVLNILKTWATSQNTIRVVLFMNEAGYVAEKSMKISLTNKENHIFLL
jgi:hypothetical protein